MKIGILADTHNNLDVTRRAIEVFREYEITFVIHAGDLTSPVMLKEFRDFDCKFVLGNGDLDIDNLNNESEKLGFGCISEYCTFTVENKKFIVFHGNNVPLFREAVASGEYDYIIKGHTHHFENYVSNNTRVINPGSLYGSDDLSVAILNTETDKVDMIRIDVE